MRAPRSPSELTAALQGAFVDCDQRLAMEPRIAVTERVRDGASKFEVGYTKETQSKTNYCALPFYGRVVLERPHCSLPAKLPSLLCIESSTWIKTTGTLFGHE